METILITGSRGFTGGYVARRFQEAGYHVVGGVHREPDPGEVVFDVTRRDTLLEGLHKVQPHGIIHLAALSFVGHADPLAFYQVNTLGTENLLGAIDECGLNLKKLIIASSANVYGNANKVVIDEGTPPNPVNHYGLSKMAMECIAKNWFERLPILIARPFNYIGPGQRPEFLVPKIVSHYKAGQRTIELGNLNVGRDFSDVRDIAEIYLKLFESSHHSEIVNLCSGTVTFLKEIIRMMNGIAQYEIEVLSNPDLVRGREIQSLCGDNRKLSSMIDHLPQRPLSQTLKDMYESS